MAGSDCTERLRAFGEKQDARNRKVAEDHRPLRDEAGSPAVRFEPPDVAPEALPHDGYLSVCSPSEDTGALQQVGSLLLSAPQGRSRLWLGKISIQSRFERKGFALAALRHLVESARLAGYEAVDGEIAPEIGVPLSGARDLYRRAGFELDHGAPNRLWFQLSGPARNG